MRIAKTGSNQLAEDAPLIGIVSADLIFLTKALLFLVLNSPKDVMGQPICQCNGWSNLIFCKEMPFVNDNDAKLHV